MQQGISVTYCKPGYAYGYCPDGDYAPLEFTPYMMEQVEQTPRVRKKPININTKLNHDEVLEIYASLKGSSFLAEKYGVSRAMINYIRTGKRWAHITGACL